MANQVGKCNMNNTPLQNAFSVNAIEEEQRQEDDFIDDKVQISETAITAELQGNLICVERKQHNISTILYNIKTELPSSEEQYGIVHDNFKKEEESLSPDDIKIESNSGLLYCEDCQVCCEDYCARCGMLVHILNRTVSINADNISGEELPNDILEMRYYCGEFRIFAVKDVPVGVKFGPFTGLNRREVPWKIKGGKFVINKDKSMYLNWMQYISPARNISDQNLLVFQYKHNLYYRSTRHIQEGEELLVYFGDEYEDSLKRNVEMDLIPAAEHNSKDAFACTFCCLGFSSKSYLAKHKAICPGNVDGEFSIEELMQCPSCEIHLDRKEYIAHHMGYCSERNERKCILPSVGNTAAQVNERKTRQHQKYKCQQTKYGTQYKGDLKNHTKQHYEVENARIGADKKDDLEYSTSVYMHARVKVEDSCSPNEVKHSQCSMCEFRTKYKTNLKRHMAEKHSRKCNYKCDKCDYKTNWKDNLKTHIDAKHLKVFKYKCDTCDYTTNLKYHLKNHTETKHLKEFKYKCYTCSYKTNVKSLLNRHIGAKHLKEFKYKCDTCEFKTNWRSALKTHIETRHLKEFKYKCDACDYTAHLKSQLKAHIKTKHLDEFKYKCDTCDYKASQKSTLKTHIETRHLKEFKYKCDTCDFETIWKSALKTHIEARHSKEFKYKCVTCDYKANRKSQLRAHIKTKHLDEFECKCDRCDYKANRKSQLKAHIEARHLREFEYKCDMCDYKANQKSTLKKHKEARHLREFKYKCDRCDYKANQKAYLTVHVKSKHLKEFNHKCGTCGYKTNDMGNLRRHVKKKHS